MPAEPTGLDATIEAYKRGIDLTLLRENLRKTPEERLRSLMKLQELATELHAAGERLRAKK